MEGHFNNNYNPQSEARRKRNIDLGGRKKSEPKVSYDDESIGESNILCDEDLEEDYEEYECENEHSEPAEETLSEVEINGKKLSNRFLSADYKNKNQTKLTVYITPNLLAVLKILKKNRKIESYSDCINEALLEYLTKQ